MKKALRDKWVKALRSGKFQQERGVLYGDGTGALQGHCCLGVLLCVADPDGWSKKARSVHQGLRHRLNGPRYKSDKLSPKALDTLGIDEDSMDKLISLNDGGMSFKKISNWIKRHL